ncbi:DUF4340 domain-containing protein [Pontiella sulfatireligans]|uniref:DUF4340 domain-containing protein n=1 Tax=Pontiella sulfatireligans TaxID=2750658 RepID=A0A6C2ULJ6_9BACT|nr:DUF4340 domain-containing protein [Pontiella sulfatireligans]VGO20211.1 hypothetical protein SCARR_02272 [Pontiella sulfatireligans]
MNGKKIIGMGAALVVLVLIAAMQQRGKTTRPGKGGKDATLLAGIDLNAMTALDVTVGSNRVALVKKDGKWGVGSLYGYPVDFDKLADAMRKAAEIKLGQPIRAGNVEASEFGLGEKAKKMVLKAGGKTVAALDVGARREASETAGWASQHFVKKDDGAAIYLVDYDFRPFSEKPEDWIKQQLLNVRSADIVSVKAGDVELKADGADWKLADLDEATEEFESTEANKLRMALQYLNCKTVADPAKTDAELGFANAVAYTAQTKDGFTYIATLGGEPDGDRYARFAVAYTKPAAPVAPGADADQEKKDAFQKRQDAFNKTCAANEKTVADLNGTLSGWTYVITSSDATDFLIGRDKLVKEKEKIIKEEGDK